MVAGRPPLFAARLASLILEHGAPRVNTRGTWKPAFAPAFGEARLWRLRASARSPASP
ncbi:MAG: hypothetical protein HY584_04355 [Candidatus Omnitrophica bacterium]|nr:hypothetical protein [Candidatus Omnitrophota bacterium]